MVVAAIAVAAGCGGTRTAPAAPPVDGLLPSEEHLLATAIEQERGGDPIGAWKLVADIPPASPIRLDRRYSELMSAWADARTREIGVEITGGKGGGPKVAKVEADPPARALSADKIEDIVASKRGKLRAACFEIADKRTSFTLKLRIDTDGRVLDAATSDVNGDPSVAECVRRHAAAWVFPKNLEGAEHRTKFIFAR